MAKRPESVCTCLNRFGQRRMSVARSLANRWVALRAWLEIGGFSTREDMKIGVQFAWFFLFVVSIAGCATVKGEKYTYSTLPKTFVAAVRENPQTVDLSRLASSSSNSDVLDRGDVVELTIAAGLSEKDTVKLPLHIHEDGFVDIPEIGRIQLAGLEMSEAEAAIGRECIVRGIYRSPNVTLLMKHQRMNRIMVTGAVKKPAIYEIPRGQCDLLAALSKAEGLDQSAGTQVVIRNVSGRSQGRPEPIAGTQKNSVDPAGHSVDHSVDLTGSGSDTIKVDLISATKNGTGGYQLQDGAVVYVEKRDPEPLHVFGLVNRPGRFEFPIAEELRLTDAIALAGGVSSLAADKIFVIRRKPFNSKGKAPDPENPDQVETFVIEISLANAKQKASSNVRLAPGDVVSVEQTPLTFMLEMFKRVGMNLGGTIPLTGTPIF